MSACSLAAPDCAQCGQPSEPTILPTSDGPLAVSLLCSSCHDLAWRDFVWIKTWAIRFRRWRAPEWVIAAWWMYWTPETPKGGVE